MPGTGLYPAGGRRGPGGAILPPPGGPTRGQPGVEGLSRDGWQAARLESPGRPTRPGRLIHRAGASPGPSILEQTDDSPFAARAATACARRPRPRRRPRHLRRLLPPQTPHPRPRGRPAGDVRLPARRVRVRRQRVRPRRGPGPDRRPPGPGRAQAPERRRPQALVPPGRGVVDPPPGQGRVRPGGRPGRDARGGRPAPGFGAGDGRRAEAYPARFARLPSFTAFARAVAVVPGHAPVRRTPLGTGGTK